MSRSIPESIARFLADAPADDAAAASADLGLDPSLELEGMSDGGVDLAYALAGELPPEHRHVPPAMAETQRTIEALLGGRDLPTDASSALGRRDEPDRRGNRPIVRRYMARMYDAQRRGSAVEVRRELAHATADQALEDHEVARLEGLAASLARRIEREQARDNEHDDDLEGAFGDPFAWGSS